MFQLEEANISKLGRPYDSHNTGNVLKASGVVSKWAQMRQALDQLWKEEGEDHAGKKAGLCKDRRGLWGDCSLHLNVSVSHICRKWPVTGFLTVLRSFGHIQSKLATESGSQSTDSNATHRGPHV